MHRTVAEQRLDAAGVERKWLGSPLSDVQGWSWITQENNIVAIGAVEGQPGNRHTGLIRAGKEDVCGCARPTTRVDARNVQIRAHQPGTPVELGAARGFHDGDRV